MSTIAAVLADDLGLATHRERVWPGFEVSRAVIPHGGLEVDGLRSHTLAVNVGRSFRLAGRIDGRPLDEHMHAGMMKVIEAGPRSTWNWDVASIDMLHVSIDDDALRGYAGELESRDVPAIATRVGVADDVLERLVRAMADELARAPGSALVTDALRIEVVTRLLAGHSSLAGRMPAPSKARIGARTLRLLEEYVEANLAADIAIGDLAALAGLSRFHFARVFRATVGVTPHRYVLERRLARALDLLRANVLSLRDVATCTGFADQSHLTRQMKRRYGATPGALRAS